MVEIMARNRFSSSSNSEKPFQFSVVMLFFIYVFFSYLFSFLLAAEKYEPCRNPGAASTSMQSNEKAFYQAGETLSFSCQPGYELQGQATIYCIPGHPSQWNNTPPACRGAAHQHCQKCHNWLHAGSRL